MQLQHFFSGQGFLWSLEFVQSLIETRDKWVHLAGLLRGNEGPNHMDKIIKTNGLHSALSLQLFLKCEYVGIVQAGVMVL